MGQLYNFWSLESKNYSLAGRLLKNLVEVVRSLFSQG